MHKILIVLFSILCFSSLEKISAQTASSIADSSEYPYWISMMQDPNANFFQVQSAFNAYWKNRPITKGSGYKPFKRWEYIMRDRVNNEGHLPAPDELRNAFNEYMARHDDPSSLAGNWVSIGPYERQRDYGNYDNGQGRLNAIAFHPTNPNIIYVGASSGGLWVTTNSGNTWSTSTDRLPTLGVSAIAIDPLNPATIYLGTGDRDASHAYGVGIMKSTDNGSTWQLANNGMGNITVGDLLIDNTNPQILYAGTKNGIYKTNDGGNSWVQKINGLFRDLSFKPGNTNIIYGSCEGKFYRSPDAGETWTQVMSVLPGGGFGTIAVTPANPERVYLLLGQIEYQGGFWGLYCSFDAGLTFTKMSNTPNILGSSCDGSAPGGQAWYDLALAADPVNPNTIYAGGIDIWKSIDAGVSWNICAQWYGGCGVPLVHADQHVFAVNPLNNLLFAGHDGGINYTADGGTTWPNISNGLVISQAYRIGQSASIDDLVISGYQDNGTALYEEGSWSTLAGGDGCNCAIDKSDPNLRYLSFQGGAINRVKGYKQENIAGKGNNGIDEDGAWVTPYIIDAQDPEMMFIGYTNIWRSSNIKSKNASDVVWKKITNYTVGNRYRISFLEQSPVNSNILYAANYAANSSGSWELYISTNCKDDNPNWKDITKKMPSGWVTAIETSPFEENTVYIIQDKKIYKSLDRGNTWTDITGGLPAIHYSSIVCYKNSREGLYIGSDAGIYYKDNSLPDWIPFFNNLPLSAWVYDLEIYYDPVSPAGDRIKAGTFGRGIWKSDMYYASPTADFKADQTNISACCNVDFKDFSTGVPYTWEWSFSGGTPATSTSQNPTGIRYDIPGTYDVQLIVTNIAGAQTLKKTGYITVKNAVNVVPGFKAVPIAYCDLNQTVQLIDTSVFCPLTWQWSFSPDNVVFENGTNANSQNPLVRFTVPGVYSVSLKTGNSNGTSSLTKSNYIAARGYRLPFTEAFENNSFDSKGWTVENPDELITWGITSLKGDDHGNAAWINLFKYMGSQGQRDRLISPPFDLTSIDPVFLTFQHAYANRFTSSSDSLIVLVSDDCGLSWNRVFAAGERDNGSLATVPKQITEFIPVNTDDWCGGGWGSLCNVINLTQWAGKPNIKIAFESYNRFGNNLYIDNVSIANTPSVGVITSKNNEFLVYPNPSSGIINIYLTKQLKNGTISIYNTQGLNVYSRAFTSTSSSVEAFDLRTLPKGIYMIKIASKHSLEEQKMIIK